MIDLFLVFVANAPADKLHSFLATMFGKKGAAYQQVQGKVRFIQTLAV